jgi:hypothetical protein
MSNQNRFGQDNKAKFENRGKGKPFVLKLNRGRLNATLDPFMASMLSGGDVISITFDRTGTVEIGYGKPSTQEKFKVEELTRAQGAANLFKKVETISKRREVQTRAAFEGYRSFTAQDPFDPVPGFAEQTTANLARVANLDHNMKLLTENRNEEEASLQAKNDLEKAGRISHLVLREHSKILATQGGRKKTSHKEIALRHSLPYWLFRKMTGARIVLGPTDDVAKVLFPKKLQKAVSMRTEEYLSIERKEYQFLANSAMIYKIARNSDLLKELNLSNLSGKEPTEKEMDAIMRESIPVIVPYTAKYRASRGFTHPPIVIGRNRLRQLSQSLNRASIGLFGRNVTEQGFWSIAAKGFNFEDEIEDKLSIVKEENFSLYEIIQCELKTITNPEFQDFLSWHSHLGMKSADAKRLVTKLLIEGDGELKEIDKVKIPLKKGSLSLFPEEMGIEPKIHVFKEIIPEEKRFLQWAASVKLVKEKKIKKEGRLPANSLLGKTSKAFLAEIEASKYKALKKHFQRLLMSFSSDALQKRTAIMLSGELSMKEDLPFGEINEDPDDSGSESEDD